MTNLKRLPLDNGLKCSFKDCEAKATVRHRAYGDMPFCDEHAKTIEEARKEILRMNTKALKEKGGRL